MIEMLLQADRLLSVDMVDQAQATYQRVVDQDPRNAIAVVGLARCALARGDDQGAYALAARALAMDPENDMARRMEARMAEVLTYRGETLPTAEPLPAVEPPSTAAPTSIVRATPSVAPSSRSWLRRLRGS